MIVADSLFDVEESGALEFGLCFFVGGQTDETGTKVVDKPVAVPDFFATIATVLGMSPSKSFMTPVGRPIAITENGVPIRDLMV